MIARGGSVIFRDDTIVRNLNSHVNWPAPWLSPVAFFLTALWILIDNKNDDSGDCVLLAFDLGEQKKMSDEKKSECWINVLHFYPVLPSSSIYFFFNSVKDRVTR